MKLIALDGAYAVCKLRAMPAALPEDGALFLARTGDEISLVCLESAAPGDCMAVERGWRALRVMGTLDFALTGILAGLSGALARAKVGLFAVSTYDTDYILVKSADLPAAVGALRAAGHEVIA